MLNLQIISDWSIQAAIWCNIEYISTCVCSWSALANFLHTWSSLRMALGLFVVPVGAPGNFLCPWAFFVLLGNFCAPWIFCAPGVHLVAHMGNFCAPEVHLVAHLGNFCTPKAHLVHLTEALAHPISGWKRPRIPDWWGTPPFFCSPLQRLIQLNYNTRGASYVSGAPPPLL